MAGEKLGKIGVQNDAHCVLMWPKWYILTVQGNKSARADLSPLPAPAQIDLMEKLFPDGDKLAGINTSDARWQK